MKQINLLLMPEDIQLCEKTKVKPVVVKPSEMNKKHSEEDPSVVNPTEGTSPIEEAPIEILEPHAT
jgi:hypothetical protein